MIQFSSIRLSLTSLKNDDFIDRAGYIELIIFKVVVKYRIDDQRFFPFYETV